MKDPVPAATQKVQDWLTALGWTLMIAGLTILAWPKKPKTKAK